MFNVRINERGQITIPKELRRKANLNPKDNLLVDLDEKGRPVSYTHLDVYKRQPVYCDFSAGACAAEANTGHIPQTC